VEASEICIGTTWPDERLHVAFPTGQVLIGGPERSSKAFGGIGFATSLDCVNYSLLGEGTSTFVNAPDGSTLYFRINNLTKMRMGPTGFLRLDNLGLIAEEVHEVEPLLTTNNSDGQIEGVKYDRLNVVVINAINEQQAQIEAQEAVIERQNRQISLLMELACQKPGSTTVCAELASL
jgi:hypothetical protein